MPTSSSVRQGEGAAPARPVRNGSTMRRPLAPSVLLLVGVLVLAGCGSSGDPSSPDDATTPTGTTSSVETPSPAPTTSAPSSPRTTDPGATEPAATEATGDCSAAGMAPAEADVGRLPDEAAATVELVLDAARRCDEQLLATAAAESETTLSFGDADPYTFFGLPDGEGVYATIVTLLTDTTYAAQADDATPATFVWPRVATGDWAEADEAWQEVVDAGLLTAAEADEMRSAGAGYLGWRIGVRGDGTWQFLVAGD